MTQAMYAHVNKRIKNILGMGGGGLKENGGGGELKYHIFDIL
jgi:hypothetical protein